MKVWKCPLVQVEKNRTISCRCMGPRFRFFSAFLVSFPSFPFRSKIAVLRLFFEAFLSTPLNAIFSFLSFFRMHFWSKKLAKEVFSSRLGQALSFFSANTMPRFYGGGEKGWKYRAARLQTSINANICLLKIQKFINFFQKIQKSEMISTFLRVQTKFIISGVFQCFPLGNPGKRGREKTLSHISPFFGNAGRNGEGPSSMSPCLCL